MPNVEYTEDQVKGIEQDQKIARLARNFVKAKLAWTYSRREDDARIMKQRHDELIAAVRAETVHPDTAQRPPEAR